MSQRITIQILDKIATCLTELPVVCGNSDYVIDFEFDAEWDNHDVKTAVFVVKGQIMKQVFTGTVCEMPVFQNTLIAWVGVFAGTIDDGTLSTSTPALVHCKPCVTDGDNPPAPPQDDVYNQIVALCESAIATAESVEERANNGEFKGDPGEKGDKGDAGVINFKIVNELPTDDIENAIYLVPSANEYGNNSFDEYIYVEGDWEQIGSAKVEINLDGYVKQTDYGSNDKAGLVKSNNSFGTFINPETGTISLVSATEKVIDGKSNNYMPIVAKHLDYAVKVAVTTNTIQLTDEEKASAQEWLGIGDIATALDNIIAIQNSLIGGGSV